jgi:hypothetical protein
MNWCGILMKLFLLAKNNMADTHLEKANTSIRMIIKPLKHLDSQDLD